MYISFEQGRRARAVLAWVLACMVGGLLLTAPLAVPMIIGDGTAPDGDNMLASLVVLLMATLYTLVVTALPAVVLVHLVRWFGWRRGIADVAVPAGILLAFSALITPTDGAQAGSWLPVILAVAAGIAGFAYWHFAGRPRPPY
ncbi:hypothetical protein [Maricaulis sp.]|uniref:hypothetical protein n=1 Tax=Maricaulis sp. TaxID=1486257 RepID=UPI003A90B16F|tara:strand:+ start:235 stop:663 length:429 start_codon:yes stop_codon:yes gene_type:complete